MDECAASRMRSWTKELGAALLRYELPYSSGELGRSWQKSVKPNEIWCFLLELERGEFGGPSSTNHTSLFAFNFPLMIWECAGGWIPRRLNAPLGYRALGWLHLQFNRLLSTLILILHCAVSFTILIRITIFFFLHDSTWLSPNVQLSLNSYSMTW